MLWRSQLLLGPLTICLTQAPASVSTAVLAYSLSPLSIFGSPRAFLNHVVPFLAGWIVCIFIYPFSQHNNALPRDVVLVGVML